MTDKTKPAEVRFNGDKYRYREYLGVVDGQTKFGPSIVLASTDAPMSRCGPHMRAHKRGTRDRRLDAQ